MKAIDDFDSLETAVMQIIPPGSSEPIGSITFAGPGHQQTVEQVDRLQRQALQQQRAKEQAQLSGRRYTPPEETPDVVRKRNIDFIVERIVDWEIASTDPTTGEAKRMIFSREAAREILGNPRRGWLVEAAFEFIGNTDNFTPRSAAV